MMCCRPSDVQTLSVLRWSVLLCFCGILVQLLLASPVWVSLALVCASWWLLPVSLSGWLLLYGFSPDTTEDSLDSHSLQLENQN